MWFVQVLPPWAYRAPQTYANGMGFFGQNPGTTIIQLKSTSILAPGLQNRGFMLF